MLVEKLKEFRQSYNRTHGQVCEFFEQAHVIEKIYQHSPGPSKTVMKREENMEECEDDCCNEQKTCSIKQKLSSWRAVMREVVTDVCPNLQLENQPDINPGLMKHVLDEIRKLKTELAFQHNTILELTHQIESYQSKNKQKDRLIENLMRRSRDVPFDGRDEQSALQSLSQNLHSVTSFDLDDTLQFGSMDFLNDLSIDLQDVQSYLLENEHGGMHTTAEETEKVFTSPSLLCNSHAITNDAGITAVVPCGDGSHEKAVESDFTEDPSSPDIPCPLGRIPSGERSRNRRAVVRACGKLGLIIVTCKMMHRLTGK